uniref:Uncharacterized protein n=1 Tax=Arundo donax TaxID=35708 RepID=A0A0A9EAV2_ARUDO
MRGGKAARKHFRISHIIEHTDRNTGTINIHAIFEQKKNRYLSNRGP